MKNLHELTEDYSIAELEELVNQRKQAASFKAVWVDKPESFTATTHAIVTCAHLQNTNQDPIDKELFYRDVMKAAFGNDYFDKLEMLHGRTNTTLPPAPIRNKAINELINIEDDLTRMLNGFANVASRTDQQTINRFKTIMIALRGSND